MYIVMRTYFEKPRTRKGWKGIMHDPDLNGSYDVEKGIRYARQCLSSITTMRVATATEFLDPFLTPYIDAIIAAREQHIVYMTSLTNSISTLLTDGNPHGHLILRGGREPNYGLSDITKAVKLMHDEGINHRLIIDCSHGNSGKVAKRQISVARQVIDNRKKIPGYVAGIMVESFLQDGKQSDSFPLEYGQSVTDECISWQQTEQLLSTLAAQL